MTSSVNGQDRLREIWAAWSLPMDETMSKAQLGALDAVSKWLEAGQTDPEVMIRVVQVLLADPERTDIRRHASWTTVCKVLAQQWVSAGTVKEHVLFGQAILLAAWPNVEQGWFPRARLFDGVWALRKGQEPKEFVEWRSNRPLAPPSVVVGVLENGRDDDEGPAITQFEGVEWDSPKSLAEIGDGKTLELQVAVKHLLPIARDHAKAIMVLSDSLTELTSELDAFISVGLRERIQPIVGEIFSHKMTTALRKLDLLWWGQSRYCRALRKPYLRMKSDPAALLWWTAREAAELSKSVNVEPAAAYLVETLHNLDQKIDEEKSVLDWMEELYATLNAARNHLPRLSKRLDDIAKLDSLGLPVTWVRRRVMDKDPFDRDAAKNDVALHLDEKIDRGDWASWVFRETLLDLHLQGSA